MTLDDTPPAPAEQPLVLVTIVHGTWARLRVPFYGNPLWFEQGSPFVEDLRANLSALGIQAEIDAFLWSGANSLFARIDASRNLARRIERRAEKSPDVRQVIVGHSHGGTVALLSLRALLPNVQPIVVTLATPFMEIINSAPTQARSIRQRVFGRESAFLLPVLLMALWAVVAPGFDIIAFSGDDKLAAYFEIARASQRDYLVLYGVGLALLLLPAFFGNAPIDVPAGPIADLSWLRKDPRRPETFAAITRGGATIDPPLNALVVRAVDDEAGLTLAAGSIGTKLLSTGLKISVRIAQLLCCTFILVLMAEYFEQIMWTTTGPTQALLLREHLANITYLVAILFCLIPIASCLFKSVYGRELILGGYFCDIKSSSAPDSAGGITIITLPPTGAGMRHGIYRHKMIASTIAKFIRLHIH
jgi:Lipase (class 3)